MDDHYEKNELTSGVAHSDPGMTPASSLTRRAFLAGVGAAATGLTGSRLLSSRPNYAQADASPVASTAMSKVVEVRSEHVVSNRGVHHGILRDMLRVGLVAFTGQTDEARAWQTILSPDDVIGLKLNQSGAVGLGTMSPMVEVLVGSLTDAGWDAAQIVPIEVPHELHIKLGTTPPRADWLPEEVQFGQARDQLAGVLEQVTAIVNVPFLKHHNIAGITCCLKNLSHALVKHPARLHGNKCTPYVGDIVALPQVRDKLRLHIVNSLRIVIDKGPDARPSFIVERGGFLLGQDPVAVDSIALELLNRVRLEGGLGKIEDRQGEVSYLRAAAAQGLGRAKLHEIEYVRHRL